METKSRKEIGRSAGKLGAGQLLGRLLGLVRDMVFASIFGVGSAADVWIVAFRIPGLLRYFIAEGAVNASIVSIASEYESQGDREGLCDFAGRAFGSLLLAVTAIILILVLATPYLLPLYAPGFAQEAGKTTLAVRLSQLSLPYVVLITLASMCMSILYVVKKFTVPALNTATFNVVMILSFLVVCPLVGGPPQRMIYGAVVGLFLAGIVQVSLQWAALRRIGKLRILRPDFRHRDVRRVFRLMAPMVIGFSLYELHVVIDIFFASRLPSGSVASLEYAARLIQVPLGLFGAALATALLPAYSRMRAEGQTEVMRATILYALRCMIYVLLPAALLVFFLRRDIVRVIFERGAFAGGIGLESTAWALGCFSSFLLAQALIQSARPAFYASQDTRTPVRTAAVGLLLKIAVSAVLVKPLGVGGLALGTVASATMDGLLLQGILARRFGFRFDLAFMRSVMKTLLSSIGLVVALLLVAKWIPGTSFIVTLARVVTSLAISIGLYFVLSRLLRAEERWFVLDLLHVPSRYRRSLERDSNG